MVSLLIYLVAVGLALAAAVLFVLAVIFFILAIVNGRASDDDYDPVLTAVSATAFCGFFSSYLLLVGATSNFERPTSIESLINIALMIDIFLWSLVGLVIAASIIAFVVIVVVFLLSLPFAIIRYILRYVRGRTSASFVDYFIAPILSVAIALSLLSGVSILVVAIAYFVMGHFGFYFTQLYLNDSISQSIHGFTKRFTTNQSTVLALWLTVGRGLYMSVVALLFIVAAALSTVMILAFIFVFQLIREILVQRLPRDQTVGRWLDAPWNGQDQEQEESRPGSRSASASRIRGIARSLPGFVTAMACAVFNKGERPIFRGTERRAREVATQRTNYVRTELARYVGRSPNREVLEVPPNLRSVVEARELSQQSADAMIVTLLSQLSLQQSVLFGRVVDAVVCLNRAVEIQASTSAEVDDRTEIVLKKLTWWQKWPGEYPWVVLIRSSHPRSFVQRLEPLREWLGIGIRTARPVSTTLQNKCGIQLRPDGSAGVIRSILSSLQSNERATVAGYVFTNECAYALTCAHAIPANCGQVRLMRGAADQPDAALLHQHDCVGMLDKGNRVHIVSEEQIDRFREEKSIVYRAGGYSRSVLGYIEFIDTAYVLKAGTVERFPVCVVKTRRLRYVLTLLPRPTFRTRFSSKGDSGSWLMMKDKGSDELNWIGMIVAGGEGDNKMFSYVLKAAPLVQYLDLQLANEKMTKAYLLEDI
jgi:hypothetical protein